MQQLSSLDAQFLALESDRNYGHVGSVAILDPSTAPGGKVTIEDVRRLLERAAAPDPSVHPPPRRGAARAGPALLGARRPLRPGLPLPRDRAAAARQHGAAGGAGGPHLLAAARPLASAVGALPDPRPARRARGAAHQDPSRGRGRDVRWRDPHAPLRPRARGARDRAAGGRRAGCRGRPRHGRDAAPRPGRAPALPGDGGRPRGRAAAPRGRARLAARRARHPHGQPHALAGAEAREPGRPRRGDRAPGDSRPQGPLRRAPVTAPDLRVRVGLAGGREAGEEPLRGEGERRGGVAGGGRRAGAPHAPRRAARGAAGGPDPRVRAHGGGARHVRQSGVDHGRGRAHPPPRPRGAARSTRTRCSPRPRSATTRCPRRRCAT